MEPRSSTPNSQGVSNNPYPIPRMGTYFFKMLSNIVSIIATSFVTVIAPPKEECLKQCSNFPWELCPPIRCEYFNICLPDNYSCCPSCISDPGKFATHVRHYTDEITM